MPRNHPRLLMCFFFLLCLDRANDYKRIQISGTAQGTTYHINYYAKDSLVTKKSIDSILTKIDSSLSLYKPYSLITRFNQSPAGIEMDEHFRNVLKKSIETNHSTGGLFDITVEPLVQAWGFGARNVDTIPDNAEIELLKKCVGTGLLEINNNFLEKKKPCVHIDMNGIAQGYSVDILAGFLEKSGINDYVVELGGEIRVHGRKLPASEKFKIGIEAPDEFETNKFEKMITPDNGAITTSGSYRKYYESNGKMITHLINPITGYPAQNELISVTVYANDAITADAFDNALMLMGLDKALRFTDRNKDLAAYFIYHKKNGEIADTASSRFYTLFGN